MYQDFNMNIYFFLTGPPQVHFCSSGHGDHGHLHGIVVRETHSQRLCFELLQPPPVLHPGCRDEMVRKRWCFGWGWGRL